MDYTTKARKTKFEHTETRKRRPFLPVSSFHSSVLLKLKIVLTVKDKCLQSPVYYYRADNWRIILELRPNKLVIDIEAFLKCLMLEAIILRERHWV